MTAFLKSLTKKNWTDITIVITAMMVGLAQIPYDKELIATIPVEVQPYVLLFGRIILGVLGIIRLAISISVGVPNPTTEAEEPSQGSQSQ